jgi:putative membrane protein
MTRDGRWPRQVYEVGDEPDPRFSLANERTFLAWIRTGLALLAVGVALEGLTVPASDAARHALVVTVVVLGAVSCAGAYIRWARAERALRQSRPLPAPTLAPLLGFGLVVVGVVVIIAVLAG